MGDLPVRIHQPEGAIFLWLWFEGLPISVQPLYERLKAKNVLVIAGHHFFPGLEEDWKHKHECIRITYSSDSESVHEGIAIIAEEVRRAYDS
jgi:valine--pyruvate aminotransferase